MNKERYNQIINETYTNYFNETNNWSKGGPHNIKLDELKMIGTLSGPISRAKIRQYTKEEFTNMCKTNSEFSEKWGLKIEERELSLVERMDLSREKRRYSWTWQNWSVEEMEWRMNNDLNFINSFNNIGVPTKLIIISYNDKTIERYE